MPGFSIVLIFDYSQRVQQYVRSDSNSPHATYSMTGMCCESVGQRPISLPYFRSMELIVDIDHPRLGLKCQG